MLNYRNKTSINLIIFFLVFIFISVSTKVYAKKDKIFIADLESLGKFEDIDSFDSPFEFQSKLNSDNKLSDFSEPSNKDDDDDIPF